MVRGGDADAFYNGVTLAGLTLLATALTANTTLRQVTLNGNDMSGRNGRINSDYAADVFAAMITQNTTLKAVGMRKCRMSETFCQRMFKAAAVAEHSALTDIDVSDNGMTAECAFAIATMCKANRSVRRLALQRNPIGDGIGHIATAIIGNTTLTELNIANTAFPAAQAESLVAALLLNRSLRLLDLSHNDLSGAASAHVAALIGHSTLRHINLSYNDLSGNNNAFMRTFQAEMHKSTLRSVLLNHCRLDDEDLIVLLQSLTDVPPQHAIKRIQLTDNFFTMRNAQRLATLIEHNKSTTVRHDMTAAHSYDDETLTSRSLCVCCLAFGLVSQ